MGINYVPYGSLIDANEYFENRLYSEDWFCIPAKTRTQALLAATRLIDNLNFIGQKTCADQPRQFPRNVSNGLVPDDIICACFELAFSLTVEGRDPDRELENLGISSQGISSVRTTYARGQVPLEHIVNSIVNLHAWRLLQPWLHEDDSVCLRRA